MLFEFLYRRLPPPATAHRPPTDPFVRRHYHLWQQRLDRLAAYLNGATP